MGGGTVLEEFVAVGPIFVPVVPVTRLVLIVLVGFIVWEEFVL